MSSLYFYGRFIALPLSSRFFICILILLCFQNKNIHNFAFLSYIHLTLVITRRSFVLYILNFSVWMWLIIMYLQVFLRVISGITNFTYIGASSRPCRIIWARRWWYRIYHSYIIEKIWFKCYSTYKRKKYLDLKFRVNFD